MTALANPRRRAVVDCFAENATPIALTDLADAVVTATSCAGPPEDVLTSLLHVHVPKLESVGLVTLDRTTRTVEPAVPADEFDRLLRGVAVLSGGQ